MDLETLYSRKERLKNKLSNLELNTPTEGTPAFDLWLIKYKNVKASYMHNEISIDLELEKINDRHR